jgi:hypothetical protein|tara:strand:- start:14379 stop:14540 length:162 start_codon:yes stop_codon:yes gene_type:complete
MRFSEVVDSVESAKEFMKVNNIIPNEIIIVWDEDIELDIIEDDSKELNHIPYD